MSLDPFAREGAQIPPPSFVDQLVEWVRLEGAWWASSFVFHMFVMIALMLIGTTVAVRGTGETEEFDDSDYIPPAPSQVQHFDLDKEDPGLDPSKMDLTNMAPEGPGGPTIQETQEIIIDDSPIFSEAGGGRPMDANGPSLGGLGGFNIAGLGEGPAVTGPGGVGVGVGTGTNPGAGGSGTGIGGRGSGSRRSMVGGFGGTKKGERAVAAALSWFARHQNPEGSWSIGYQGRCRDATCQNPGIYKYDSAATALALLPFLGAGQTHKDEGPYKANVRRALTWLVRSQTSSGDLGSDSSAHRMYCHGIATIALCEAYAMTKDEQLRKPAQLAVDFIRSAQNQQTGGWRYHPGDPGDTSVVGWQLMALKSAQMAGLYVDTQMFTKAQGYLDSVSAGNSRGLFAYQAQSPPSFNMTAVGILCCQYMGLQRSDSRMSEGVALLMSRLPDPANGDLYGWYYATQALHNVPGPEWDTWNRRMRRVLIDGQAQEGCASGSWDPRFARNSIHLSSAGRLVSTSLATMSLEVYYRYLPLYKVTSESAVGTAVIQPGTTVPKLFDSGNAALPPVPLSPPAASVPPAKPPQVN